MIIKIIIKSFYRTQLKKAISNIEELLISNNIILISRVIHMPTSTKKYCILRSPHVDENSREHFEFKIFKAIIELNITSINQISIVFNSDTIECEYQMFIKN